MLQSGVLHRLGILGQFAAEVTEIVSSLKTEA